MTVKQLLDSLSFDEIAPYIVMRYEGRESAENVLVDYKQQFDFLHYLVPTDPEQLKCKAVRVSYCKDDRGVYLGAYPLEGVPLEDCLSKELIINKDVTECNAEIAACCLWHMSFYGFLPYQQRERLEAMFGGIEWQRKQIDVYKSKFASVIPSEKEIMAIRSFHNEIRSKMKSLLLRKRYRAWKRHLIRQTLYNRIIWNSAFIEDILERGQNISGAPTLQELGILYHANHLSIERLESITFDAEKRFDYLKELIEKYGASKVARKKMSEYTNSFICLSASSEHPVTEEEKTLVNFLTEGLLGTHRLCIKTDEACGDELRIDVAYYELPNFNLL